MNKHDAQMHFVRQVIAEGIAASPVCAAIWFRDTKAWKLTTAEALRNFKDWVAA